MHDVALLQDVQHVFSKNACMNPDQIKAILGEFELRFPDVSTHSSDTVPPCRRAVPVPCDVIPPIIRSADVTEKKPPPPYWGEAIDMTQASQVWAEWRGRPSGGGLGRRKGAEHSFKGGVSGFGEVVT